MKRALFLLVALAGSSAAQAQPLDIRVDMSNLAGTTAGNWNNIAFASGLSPNLIDFNTGVSTGVSLNGSGSPWLSGLGDEGGTFVAADWMLTSAAADGFALAGPGTGVYTFGSLPAGDYVVEVVSARTQFGYLNTFTANGVLADRTFQGTPVVTPWNSTTNGLDPSNWLIWSSVAATGGMISIQLDSGPGTPGIMNAVRISTVVPAPGAAMTLVTGLALIARRRRA